MTVNAGLICVDVDGTLTRGIGGPPIDGAAVALEKLRRHLPVRLVTNATSRSHAMLSAWLADRSLLDHRDSLVTPATVARRVLEHRQQASGVLLVEPAAREDFHWFQEEPGGGTVLVATEGHSLGIADLQEPFRALLDGAALYTLQQNRYFRQGEDLVTDLGPLAAFLAYASDTTPQNLGKPSPLLFDALAREVSVPREAVVMIGDDAEFDAGGAVGLGMQGLLVRTGKYRSGDEKRFAPVPTAVLDSITDLPAWLGID